jgi:hypothetical protein
MSVAQTIVHTYIIRVDLALAGYRIQYPITRMLAVTMMIAAARGLKLLETLLTVFLLLFLCRPGLLFIDTASLPTYLPKYIIAIITEKVN